MKSRRKKQEIQRICNVLWVHIVCVCKYCNVQTQQPLSGDKWASGLGSCYLVRFRKKTGWVVIGGTWDTITITEGKNYNIYNDDK